MATKSRTPKAKDNISATNIAERTRTDLSADARAIWKAAYEAGQYDIALKGIEVESKVLGLWDTRQIQQAATSITIAWQGQK